MLRAGGRLLAPKMSKEVKQSFKFLKANAAMNKEELKMTFRSLAKQLHPDVNQGNDTKMKELNRAYAVVTQYIEEHNISSTASTARAPRKAEDRQAKQQELSLVQRLARWMRESAADDSKQAREDPTVQWKDYIEKQRATDEATLFYEGIGTPEQEEAYAQRFHEERLQRLAEKNQFRTSEDERAAANPFSPYSRAVVTERLQKLTLADPYYWKVPPVEPRLPTGSAGDGFLGPGSASPRANPHIALAQRDRRERFFNEDVWELVAREKRAALHEKNKNVKRYIAAVKRSGDGDSGARRALLEKKVEYLHDSALRSGGLPKAAAEATGPLGARPPSRLRKNGALITVPTKDQMGRPVTVTMAKTAFIARNGNV
ncbi:hypothetical protein DIPPA_02768 [Diplonema papillatum]|nr:hypothetical protein DIPPA_02768 [Diplonema papillatum]